MEGPRVSGPRLGVWGGNTNALLCPNSYRCLLVFVYSMWDYVPHDSYLLQVTWQHDRRSRQPRWRRSRGPESTRSSNNHVRKIWDQWRRSKGVPDDTWRHEESLIFIKSNTSRSHDLHRSVQSSLNQTHCNRTIFIGHGFIGRSRSFAISGSGSTAWTHCDHPISIRRTTMDSSRVHDCEDHHRTVDQNLHQEDRKAHLLTCGRKWRVRLSSNVQSRSAARSPSNGHDSPRSSSHLGDEWNFPERRISIRQPPQVESSQSSKLKSDGIDQR